MRVDFDRIKERMTALWNHEILDRCCVSVIYEEPEKRQAIDAFPVGSEDRMRYWTDPEIVLQRNLSHMDNTYYAGDAFPLVSLNLGPAGHAGFVKNMKWSYEPSTIWFTPFMQDELNPESIIFDENSFLFQKTLEHARYFRDECRGEYLISMPDLAGNMDVLAALRGSQELLVDFLAEDEAVIRECLDRIQRMWEAGLEETYKIVEDCNHGGSTIGWLRTWAPGFHGQIQCDISVMFSNDIYEKYARRELEKQSGNITLYLSVEPGCPGAQPSYCTASMITIFHNFVCLFQSGLPHALYPVQAFPDDCFVFRKKIHQQFL